MLQMILGMGLSLKLGRRCFHRPPRHGTAEEPRQEVSAFDCLDSICPHVLGWLIRQQIQVLSWFIDELGENGTWDQTLLLLRYSQRTTKQYRVSYGVRCLVFGTWICSFIRF